MSLGREPAAAFQRSSSSTSRAVCARGVAADRDRAAGVTPLFEWLHERGIEVAVRRDEESKDDA